MVAQNTVDRNNIHNGMKTRQDFINCRLESTQIEVAATAAPPVYGQNVTTLRISPAPTPSTGG